MRRHADDLPIIVEGTSGDEELGLPCAAWPQRRIALVLVGVGLVGGGLVALSRNDDRAVAPRPRSTSTIPVVVTTRIAAEPTDIGQRVALGSSPERCPATINCFTGRLPAQVVAALHRLLPAAVVRSKVAVTQTNPLRIYFRQLHATDGAIDVRVRITRSNILDGLEATEQVWTSATRRFAFVRVITADAYEVEVQLSGPVWERPPIRLARTLAADSALLTLERS